MKTPRPLAETLPWLNATAPLREAVFTIPPPADFLAAIKREIGAAKRKPKADVGARIGAIVDVACDPIVRQVVNRDCHVGEPYPAVLRHVRSKLKPGAWEGMTRPHRRWLVFLVCVAHAANQALYRRVMRGW